MLVTMSFLCAIAECFARLSYGPWPGRLSVCPSVLLSVTLLYCAKTVQARVSETKFTFAPLDKISLFHRIFLRTKSVIVCCKNRT